MPRRKTTETEIEIGPECADAYQRLVEFANELSADLTGDPMAFDTPRSAALAMGMILFLIRADPRDLHAAFFGEKSFAQFNWKPMPPDVRVDPLFAPLLGGTLGEGYARR